MLLDSKHPLSVYANYWNRYFSLSHRKAWNFPVSSIRVATLATLLWYQFIGAKKVTQSAGAIHHIYERLGRAADTSVDREISAAMQSHGLRSEDDYAGLIARASVLSVPHDGDIDLAAYQVSQVLGNRIGIDADKVNDRFLETGSLWIQPSQTHPTATPVAFFDAAEDDHLVIVKSEEGICSAEWGGRNERVNALFFLAGTTAKPDEHFGSLESWLAT